jgi:hypothetical protein
MECQQLSLERQVPDTLRRAWSRPVGADRCDFRRLAVGLLWPRRNGMDALVAVRTKAIASLKHSASG